MTPFFGPVLMGVLSAGVAGGRMSIMTTRRRKSPEQIVRLLGQADQLPKNSDFHRPIDCSDTFSRRAASARLISPAKIDNTIRIFFSAGITGGLPIVIGSLHHKPIIS